MSTYTTVTLTAIQEGDTVVLLDSRGVAITRIEAGRIGQCDHADAAWMTWGSVQLDRMLGREFRKKRMDDPWERKVSCWMDANKRRRKKALVRGDRRFSHEPHRDKDWAEAIRRMMNRGTAKARRTQDGEWERWVDSVGRNARRRGEQAADQQEGTAVLAR